MTVSGYDRDLKLWIEYQGDMDVAQVETTHILSYLSYLRTDYVARRFLWRYLAEREHGDHPDAPLFLGNFHRPFNRDALRQSINYARKQMRVLPSNVKQQLLI